jgi:hypothetical protein
LRPSQPASAQGGPGVPAAPPAAVGSILQRPSEPLPSAAPPPALIAQERAPTQPVSPLKGRRAPRRTIVPLLIGLVIVAALAVVALLILRGSLPF